MIYTVYCGANEGMSSRGGGELMARDWRGAGSEMTGELIRPETAHDTNSPRRKHQKGALKKEHILIYKYKSFD